MGTKPLSLIIILLFSLFFSACARPLPADKGDENGVSREKSQETDLFGNDFTYKDLDNSQKEQIDIWLEQNGFNRYGDPAGVVYTGGTPLFDERTGTTKDRFEYILERHPEILTILFK